MSASFKTQRVWVYAYSDSGADGRVSTRYTRVRNPETADGAWAAAMAPAGTREATIAGQAQQHVDMVFTMSDRAPVDSNGVLKEGSTLYTVSAPPHVVRARGEQVVYATHASDEVYSNLVET